MDEDSKSVGAFDLSGGHLALDYANTLSGRATEPLERLQTYADLLAWSREAEAVTRAEAAALRKEMRRSPRAAEAALEDALRVREVIYRIFAALATGGSPAPADLAALNRALPESLAHARLSPAEDGFRWGWERSSALDRPLWPIVRSAAGLLTSDELDRLRLCDADTCQWLFLDRSRNRSRKWCDMQVCGNRAKAQRHYRRQKAAALGTGAAS